MRAYRVTGVLLAGRHRAGALVIDVGSDISACASMSDDVDQCGNRPDRLALPPNSSIATQRPFTRGDPLGFSEESTGEPYVAPVIQTGVVGPICVSRQSR